MSWLLVCGVRKSGDRSLFSQVETAKGSLSAAKRVTCPHFFAHHPDVEAYRDRRNAKASPRRT